MASAQVVETSVNNNSPSQDSNHPDDLFQSRYVTPGFKPFSYKLEHLTLADWDAWYDKLNLVKTSFQTDIDDLLLETSINEQENDDDDGKTYQIEC